jgi:hypothetical protein
LDSKVNVGGRAVYAIDSLALGCHSESPVIRADWFIVNASVAPAYYDLLGIGKTLREFEQFVFANEDVARIAKSQDKGIVVSSIVVRNNRTLTRSPTLGSSYAYYWRSHDSLRSTGDRDYVKRILDETFDATEDIATLPNGLQVYFLSDGKGARLDFADPNIAIDNTAVDRIVRTGRSCMICHSDGIRNINDEIRSITRMLTNKEQVKLIAVEEEKIYRVQDLFGSDLTKQIGLDQQRYQDAVASATGIPTSAKNASQLSAFWDGYAEHPLGFEVAARECGLTVAEFGRYIRGMDLGNGTMIGSNDNVILGFIKNPARNPRRDQWEQSYQGWMLTIKAIRGHEAKIQEQKKGK